MSFQNELDAMNADIKGTFGVPVTLRRNTPGALNTATMNRAVVAQDTAVSAVRGASSIAYDGGFKEEEVTYSILAADLAARPEAGDQVIDTGVTRTGIKAAVLVDQKWYEFTTRRKI